MGHNQNGSQRGIYKIWVFEKKKMNNKIKHWEEKIQNQQKELYKEPGNLKALEELELAKNELNLIIESKTRGAIIRSRVQWFEEGEKY